MDAGVKIVTSFALNCPGFVPSPVWRVLGQTKFCCRKVEKALQVNVPHDTFSPVEGSRNMRVRQHIQLSRNEISKTHKGELTWDRKIISIDIRKSKQLINILFNSTSWETIYLLQGPVRFLPDMNLIFSCYLDTPDNLLFTSMFLVSPHG